MTKRLVVETAAQAAGAAGGAAQYPAVYKVEEVPVMRGDVQPRTHLHIEANVTDAREVFVRRESTRLVWPFDPEASTSRAQWAWRRSLEGKDQHGVLTVHGLDASRVRELFKGVSEMFRTDDDLRRRQYLEATP